MAWRGLGSQLSPQNSPRRASRKDSLGLASSVREISRTRAVFRQPSQHSPSSSPIGIHSSKRSCSAQGHSHTANLKSIIEPLRGCTTPAANDSFLSVTLVPFKSIIFTGGYRGNHLQTNAASKVRADRAGASLVTQGSVSLRQIRPIASKFVDVAQERSAMVSTPVRSQVGRRDGQGHSAAHCFRVRESFLWQGSCLYGFPDIFSMAAESKLPLVLQKGVRACKRSHPITPTPEHVHRARACRKIQGGD